MRGVLRFLQRFGSGRLIGLLLLADLLFIRLWDPAPVEIIRHKAFDLYQRIQPRAPSAERVAIVDIDEESLKALGQWPWPRTIVADLVSRLSERGVMVIGFDILFPEEDRTSPVFAARSIRGLDEQTREALRRLPDNDSILAEAIGSARVVLGQSGYRTVAVDDAARPQPQTGLAVVGENPAPILVSFPDLLRNLPILEAAASGRGLLSVKQEDDGIIRRIPMIATANGVVVPALSLDMVRVAQGASSILVRSDRSGVQAVGVQAIRVPTDWRGRAWLHFAPHDPGRYIPAIRVLNNEVPRERLSGKFILIGTSATGLFDLKSTPLDAAIPGVELHAQLIESILTGALLERPFWATALEFIAASVLSLILIAFGPVLRAATLLVLGGIIAAAALALSWVLFSSFGILVDATFPLAASFSVYLLLVFTNYIRTFADRQRIRSAFSQYVAPAIVDELVRSPEKLALGGDRRDMTVMLSDVRGFTAVSEGYKEDPQGLTVLLNSLFTPLTEAIISHKGTIDKYMGDGIMAFWNAPILDPSHEENACEAALNMLDRLAILNQKRIREAPPDGPPVQPLQIGIGLNTGPCFVGNFGSDLHFNYSVLGDPVNLSSRLESQCKTYGVPIVAGTRTAKAVAGRLAVLELDCVQVVGKTEPERIFTILGRGDVRASLAFRKLSEFNQVMLAAYRQASWEEALEMVFRSRDLARGFGLESYHALMIARIRKLKETPSLDDWRGITVLESK